MQNGGEVKNKFIPELIIDHLNENGVEFISCLPKEQGVTINDIISYCENEAVNHGVLNVNFKKIINEAISLGYDKRYLNTTKLADERAISYDCFVTSFKDILSQLNISLFSNDTSIIVVGVGNGIEGQMLYSDIKNLTIVDIAPNSLKQAKIQLPNAQALQVSADNLISLADSSFDLYVSLRTFQSTYFDIFTSLQEAKRILKNKGSIIISIACGYLDDNYEFIYGLYNPHNGILEQDRPGLFVTVIENILKELSFSRIRIKKIPTEIFIFATKGTIVSNND